MILPGILSSGISGHLYSYNTSFTQIATQTVGAGGASSITFSSIPSTYTHLQLRIIGRTDYSSAGPTNMFLRFNGDTGNNYSTHNIHGNGSTASAIGDSSNPFMYVQDSFPTAGNSANIFGAMIIDILDYANVNKNKTVRNLYGNDYNGSGTVGLDSHAWYSTSAINSITFYPGVGGTNLVQYSQAALYGVA
jgi:hypothetical protein